VTSVSVKLPVALIWIKQGEVDEQGRWCVGVCAKWRKRMKKVRKAAIAVSAFACAAIFSFNWSKQDGISMSVEGAQARVGRPLTPVSVAGVARRQTRRAVYGAGIAGATVVGTAAAVAAAPYYGGAGYYTGGPYYGGAGYTSGGPYYGGAGYTSGGPYYGGTGYTSAGPYQGGPRAAYGAYPVQDYATRNGFVCQPGSLVTLDDGRQYPCQ
jgi:hypothetical protein